jgi:hypothetical protein
VSDWRTRMVDRIATSKQRNHYTQTQFMVRAWPQFYALVDQAAFRRDVSRSVYMRRMTAVGLAHDLGIDIKDALRFTAHWRSKLQDKSQAPRDDAGRLLATSDDAYRIADWCPHPDCDGEHLLAGPFTEVGVWL